MKLFLAVAGFVATFCVGSLSANELGNIREEWDWNTTSETIVKTKEVCPARNPSDAYHVIFGDTRVCKDLNNAGLNQSAGETRRVLMQCTYSGFSEIFEGGCEKKVTTLKGIVTRKVLTAAELQEQADRVAEYNKNHQTGGEPFPGAWSSNRKINSDVVFTGRGGEQVVVLIENCGGSSYCDGGYKFAPISYAQSLGLAYEPAVALIGSGRSSGGYDDTPVQYLPISQVRDNRNYVGVVTVEETCVGGGGNYCDNGNRLPYKPAGK